MGLKIAIVGAGPAGCLLARLLKHRADNDTDIDITIFESEKSIDYRSQGGTLDLRAKTGQRALKEAGLYDEFLKHARFDGEALSIADKDFVRYLTVKGNQNANSVTSGRPEIDRPVLRRILYESLPEGTVCWNHKLDHIEEPGTLHFTNQPPRSGFDLIVGADGAWSKVRNHLSATKPYYSGISGHAFSIPNAAQSTPDLFAQTNRGSLFAWSDNKSIMAQCMGDGSLSIYTWSRRPDTWKKDCGYDVHDAKAVKEACLRDYADWDPRLVAYTQRAEEDVVPRDLYMLPVGFEWEHVRGVTLVGDAAHLMVSLIPSSSSLRFAILHFVSPSCPLTSLGCSNDEKSRRTTNTPPSKQTPFAGEGVNLAFEDSMELADAILTKKTQPPSPQELDSSIRSFESDIFVRAKKTSRLTSDLKDLMFVDGKAPRKNIESYLLRLVGNDNGWVATMGVLAPLVYAYFFVFRLVW
jgi:2-polyprenyl-6-methoxyphenol hydroxylase-like FAD-dependent oxidoreductase